MSCPVCGAASRTTSLSRETTRIFVVEICSACGLAFTTPRPSPAELDEFYTENYFTTDVDGLGYADYRGDSWAEANARAMWRSLHAWAPIAPRERSVLDIGCATGGFLAEALADGWKVQGVEKSAAAAAIAVGEFGVPVFNEVGLVEDSFGLITMWHVLEHLLDPVGTLVEARTRVADDGYLFIELPQWGALGRRRNKERWSQLRPPEHINFFSKKSLRVAVEAAGWRVVRQETVQPDVTNQAVELIRRGRVAKGAALALSARMVERAGLGGYLRCLAVSA